MALGLFAILFAVSGIISIVGLLALYVTRSPKQKKGIFCFLALWGLLIAALSASSLPSNDQAGRLFAWIIGLLGVIGLAVYLKSSSKMLYIVSYLLITISAAGGILNLFF